MQKEIDMVNTPAGIALVLERDEGGATVQLQSGETAFFAASLLKVAYGVVIEVDGDTETRLLPCAICEEWVSGPVCRYCGGDPEADTVPCPDCKGSGSVAMGGPAPWSPSPGNRECSRCIGNKEVDAPCFEFRDEAKKTPWPWPVELPRRDAA